MRAGGPPTRPAVGLGGHCGSGRGWGWGCTGSIPVTTKSLNNVGSKQQQVTNGRSTTGLVWATFQQIPHQEQLGSVGHWACPLGTAWAQSHHQWATNPTGVITTNNNTVRTIVRLQCKPTIITTGMVNWTGPRSHQWSPKENKSVTINRRTSQYQIPVKSQSANGQ